jgi:hypothetical protein
VDTNADVAQSKVFLNLYLVGLLEEKIFLQLKIFWDNCVSTPVSKSNCDFTPTISNRRCSLPLDRYVILTVLNML